VCSEKDTFAAVRDKFSGAGGEVGVIGGITGNV